VKARADFQQTGHAAVVVIVRSWRGDAREDFQECALARAVAPMMPTTSPCLISRLMSLSAQKYSGDSARCFSWTSVQRRAAWLVMAERALDPFGDIGAQVVAQRGGARVAVRLPRFEC